MPLENTDFTQNEDYKALEQEINAAANEMRANQSRAAARNARNTSGQTSYDEVLDKISNWGDKTSSAIGSITGVAGGVAATIGNIVGNVRNGYNNANARPINDIKVESDSLKTFGVLLVILAVIFVFKKNK